MHNVFCCAGADGYGIPDFVCDIYFNGQMPCFGGVLSLDGVDGKELWRHWTGKNRVFLVPACTCCVYLYCTSGLSTFST